MPAEYKWKLSDRAADLPYDPKDYDAPPTTCVAEDCDRPVRARGMCLMHWKRFERNGSLDLLKSNYGKRPAATRAERRWRARWERVRKGDYGEHTWSSPKHFRETVGDPPDEDCRFLRKKDKSKPIGPDNFIWLTRDGSIEASERKHIEKKSRKKHAKYVARYNKSVHLQKMYGVTMAEFNTMYLLQGGICAICGNPEKSKNQDGTTKYLAVDHDHKTGAVRGLLCRKCNHMLGYGNDDPEVLKQAAKYLLDHNKISKSKRK
jgi:hypothetical protein